MAAALDDGDDAEVDAMLHRARKASKRARYAAELCQEMGMSKRMVERYKRIQTVLGNHQDSVVASTTLRRMGIAAGTTDGENGFTFGMLMEQERRFAEECRRQARGLTR